MLNLRRFLPLGLIFFIPSTMAFDFGGIINQVQKAAQQIAVSPDQQSTTTQNQPAQQNSRQSSLEDKEAASAARIQAGFDATDKRRADENSKRKEEDDIKHAKYTESIAKAKKDKEDREDETRLSKLRQEEKDAENRRRETILMAAWTPEDMRMFSVKNGNITASAENINSDTRTISKIYKFAKINALKNLQECERNENKFVSEKVNSIRTEASKSETRAKQQILIESSDKYEASGVLFSRGYCLNMFIIGVRDVTGSGSSEDFLKRLENHELTDAGMAKALNYLTFTTRSYAEMLYKIAEPNRKMNEVFASQIESNLINGAINIASLIELNPQSMDCSLTRKQLGSKSTAKSVATCK